MTENYIWSFSATDSCEKGAGGSLFFHLTFKLESEALEALYLLACVPRKGIGPLRMDALRRGSNILPIAALEAATPRLS